MSTPEVRSSIKWSAIRSKAVPSNLTRSVTHTVTNMIGAAEGKMENKPGKDRNALPARLHKAAAFAGSTGSSHL